MSCASIWLASLDYSGPALIIATAACALMLMAAHAGSDNYLSVSFIFFLFISLYGLLGPLAALSEKGLAPVFVRPYLVNNYIFGFSLATIGSVCAIGTNSLISQTQPSPRLQQRVPLNEMFDATSATIVAYLFSLSASAFEIVNIVRAGGTSLLFGGKAAYQGIMADMYGTIPSEWFLYVASSMLGLSIYSSKMKMSRIIFFIIFSAPIITSWLLLGRRFEIVACMLIFYISLKAFDPIRQIKTKYVFLATAAYVAISSLYVIRPWVYPAYIYGDIGIIFENVADIEIWATNLNPSSNEFQAPFANFNTHFVLRMMPEGQHGLTYLGGMAEPIPRFIWPDKPISSTYQFRDTYFASWSERGSIAGTGYSSILEAYINFGWAGILAVFFIVSSAILFIESLAIKYRSVWMFTIYSLMIPFSIFFSRKSLGNPIMFPVIFATLSLALYVTIRHMIEKNKVMKLYR